MSTELCTLARQYGVDKCPAILHSYTPAYHALLHSVRDTTKLVLEIGIGNIPLMKRIVGPTYTPGASLRMWRDYFPQAQIIGCDILRSVLFSEERIHTQCADQGNVESLQELITCSKTYQEYADLIVDDGSHVEAHMRISFKTLWPFVRPQGGIYIIEDIKKASVSAFTHLASEFGFADATCVVIHPGKNNWDGFVAFRKS